MADECAKLRAEIVELEKKLKSTIEKKDSLKLMVSRVEVEEYELTSQLREKKQAFRVLAESSAPSPQQAPQGVGQQDYQQGQEPLQQQQQQQQEPVQSVANQRMRGVLSNLKEFRGLVERLPRIPLNLGEAKDRLEDEGLMPHRVVGPHDPYALTPPDVDVIGTRVAAKTISTYPMNTAHTKREGNPICDCYLVEVNPECTFVAIGDGCNWGVRPLEASKRATEGFISHTVLNYAKSENTHDIGDLLLESFASAHNEIISGKREIWEAGTTTLIGSIVYPFSSGEYGVTVLSIGDCKCFRWSAADRKITDITKGNRGNLNDARDPGGRIGPYVGDGMPDTRNLSLFFDRCRDGDMLIYCTDGVHDNLDAGSLGVDPEEFTEDFKGMTWDQASMFNKELAEGIKSAFYEARLEMILNEQHDKEAKEKAGSSDFVPTPPTPKEVAELLLDYCTRVTLSSRTFMEANPSLKLPSDYKLYPGKMDHTTCVVVRVGKQDKQN